MNNTKVENRLFTFTRVFAVVMAVLGILALAGILTLSAINSMGKSTYITLADTLDKPDAESSDGLPSIWTGLTMPENLEPYFKSTTSFVGDTDNKKVLEGWLMGLIDEDERQDFLNNLSGVVARAKNEDKEKDINEIINNYRSVKLAKIVEARVDKFESIGEKIGFYGSIFSLLIFISLMSMMLVMLAIERNTRR